MSIIFMIAWGLGVSVNSSISISIPFDFRSIGYLVIIWWVFSRGRLPKPPLEFDQNLEDPKIGPFGPFFRGHHIHN